jgi:hypothetical protein
VELGHPATERRGLFDDVDVAACFRGFDGRADPGHPAADHEDSSLAAGGGGLPVPVRDSH